jgi:hypothetical protein
MAMVEYLATVLLETVDIMAMVVSMVVSMVVFMVVTMVVTLASVKLTASPRLMLMPTPSDRLPMDSLRLMPMLLVTHTTLESLLELIMAMVEYLATVLLETVDIMAMVVSMVVSMVVFMVVTMVVTLASVKLTASPRLMLMPTPSDRLPMDSLRLMPMLLVTHTTLESLLELIMAMVEYLDTVLLVTEDTSAPLATVDTHTMAE